MVEPAGRDECPVRHAHSARAGLSTLAQSPDARQRRVLWALRGPCPGCGAPVPPRLLGRFCVRCGTEVPGRPLAVIETFPGGLSAQQEHIAWMGLRHTALAPVREIGEHPVPYVLYGYTPGTALPSIGRPLPVVEAITWSLRLGDLVAYLQRSGVAAFGADDGLDRLLATANGPVMANVLDCSLLPANAGARADRVSLDVYFVTKALAFLLTGRELADGTGQNPGLPRRVWEIIAAARAAKYTDVPSLLGDVRSLLPARAAPPTQPLGRLP
jgi:hypothetical protein